MKIVKYNPHSFWIAVTILPVYNLMLSYSLIGDAYFANLATFGNITLITMLTGLPACQFLHTREALWFRNCFPAYHQPAKQWLLMLPVAWNRWEHQVQEPKRLKKVNLQSQFHSLISLSLLIEHNMEIPGSWPMN